MTKILKGQATDLSEYTGLESFEVTLIKSFVSRKYNNAMVDEAFVIDPNFKSFRHLIRPSLLKHFIDFLQHLVLVKRVEENNKFVFKHTTSYLYTKFAANQNLKFNNLTENEYYLYYFDEYAKRMGAKISEFFDPLKNQSNINKKIKSLNTDYLLRILNCKKFKADFFEYLNTDFVDHYLSAIYKKMERMLHYLETKMEETTPDKHDELLRDFIRHKINQRWCKIPWTASEVISAVSHFKSYFNSMLTDKTPIKPKHLQNIPSSKNLSVGHLHLMSKPVSYKPFIQQTKTKHYDIQSIGIIMDYKRPKKVSLSIFDPDSLYLKFKRGN